MEKQFKVWLLEQVKRNDPVGDLARDALYDRANWGGKGKPSIDERVRNIGHDVAEDALKEARAEWRRESK